MKKKLLIIIEILLVIVLLFSLYKIINWFINNKETKDIQKEVKEKVILDDIKINTTIAHKINFSNLKDINSDGIAWLTVNNTNVDYPILQTTNNDYYLTHNLYKEKSDAGWPFLDYRNNLNDKNIIIYAHNRLDGSMFGSLKDLKKNHYFNNLSNREIVLMTKNATLEYEIFSVYEVPEEKYYLKTNFDKKEFTKFLNTIKNRSIYKSDVDLDNTTQVLTLSTCTQEDNKRLVVHAKR